MKMTKLLLLAVCLSMSSCCCNDTTGIDLHLSPSIKNSLPYKNGQQFTFIDSATNKKILVNCTTSSKYESFKCYNGFPAGSCNCHEDEYETYTIQLTSPDSVIQVQLRMTTNGTVNRDNKDSSHVYLYFSSKDSSYIRSVNIKVNYDGKFQCEGRDPLNC